MSLKRLWDTENKKVVWAIPTWDPHTKLQVWTNDDGSKLYVYTWSAFRELSLASATVSEYGPVWKALDDETVGYYLTNVPTDLYNWDEGDEVAYRFMNWTTVLQSWKVDEWETPEYTWDTPTKSATAQYTYTFSWWKPTVWPIYKKTDFKAQFTSTVNEYDITIESNDTDYWTVDVASVEWQPYGTAISAEWNVLTIGSGADKVEVTATAEEWYEFDSWWELPATVTWDLTITATFKHVMHTVTFALSNVVWDENENAYVPAESQDPLRGSVSPASVQVPHGWIFVIDNTDLIFYDAWWQSTDDDAIHVTLSPSQWYILAEAWTDMLPEISWLEYDESDDQYYVIWNISAFPVTFEPEPDPEDPQL